MSPVFAAVAGTVMSLSTVSSLVVGAAIASNAEPEYQKASFLTISGVGILSAAAYLMAAHALLN
ncbi:MAG: hypothetical protein SPH79_03975 [Schaalia hyovaginalis]|uniref:Membrane protein YkgB n=1 Tax=Schaalia hyovaginalis TaxID=29316 RepID=A0A923E8I7_9ACTO|nr:hypothetical protein [Schaalia hyovaginalis]MBB6335429.1 putative membrane protein YkgB [Schaalia hyovaginalis]MDY6213629.1 hypothetical protein [Schaalia hyovaginalis]